MIISSGSKIINPNAQPNQSNYILIGHITKLKSNEIVSIKRKE
jgi:hypothetical protein